MQLSKVQEEEVIDYSRQEFSSKGFERVFNLPENQIDEDKIEAHYNNGVLIVRLPKREELKPKKREITVG